MIGLVAHLVTGDVDRRLAAIARFERDMGGAFREAKPVMRADQRDHAKRQQSSDGAWPQRAQSTIESARKKGRARKTLGRLPVATTYQSTSTVVRAFSRVPWSGAHQFGAKVGRGSTIPAREYLWVSDELAGKVAAIFAKHVGAAWDR